MIELAILVAVGFLFHMLQDIIEILEEIRDRK